MIARGRITIYTNMEGSDAYSVSLSSSYGIINLPTGGTIDTAKRIHNVVNGANNISSNGQNIAAESYPLTTTIQAFRGSSELLYSTITTKGAYTVALHPKGCEAQISNGVLSILAVTDPTSADVILTVNCEGNAVFHKRYYITIVSNGTDGKPSTSYSLVPSVTQIGCNSLGSYEPSNFSVSLYSKTGDQDMLPYDAHIVVWGYNGSSWVEHKYVHSSSISVGSLSSYKQYCVKAYSVSGASFDSESIATVSVNVVKNGENFASGAMPRNCGEYDSTKHYEYNKDFRDIVWVKSGAISEVYQVASFGTSPTGAPPNNGWMAGNRNTFTAIDTALIDGADIAGFLFKDGVMQSRDQTEDVANTIINGKTGEIITRKLTAIDANITGVINATTGKIGRFTIDGGTLKNESYSGSIIVRNEARTVGAIIGTNTVAPSTGFTIPARIFNNIVQLADDSVDNIAMIVEASGCPEFETSGGKNIAIEATGTVRITQSNSNNKALHIVSGELQIDSRCLPVFPANKCDKIGWSWEYGVLVRYT